MNIPDRREFLLELLSRAKEHCGYYCPITEGMIYDGICCALHYALWDMVQVRYNITSCNFSTDNCKSVFPKVYAKIRSDIVESDNKDPYYLYPLDDEGYVKRLAYIDELIINVDLYT
jgi:hypothetical protein